MRTTTKKTDKQTARIYAALKAAFPDISDDEDEVIYKYNPYSIRVRIIDKSFAELSLAQRHAAVKRVLARLNVDDTENISMLMMLSPEEATETDLMNLEFDDPGRSRI